MGGAIFENLVASELYKTIIHRGDEPKLYFWRTASGSEVDLILETQRKLVPIEVKLSATPRPEMAREIARFRKDFGDQVGQGYVIHPGDTILPLGDGNIAMPFSGI